MRWLCCGSQPFQWFGSKTAGNLCESGSQLSGDELKAGFLRLQEKYYGMKACGFKRHLFVALLFGLLIWSGTTNSL